MVCRNKLPPFSGFLEERVIFDSPSNRFYFVCTLSPPSYCLLCLLLLYLSIILSFFFCSLSLCIRSSLSSYSVCWVLNMTPHIRLVIFTALVRLYLALTSPFFHWLYAQRKEDNIYFGTESVLNLKLYRIVLNHLSN